NFPTSYTTVYPSIRRDARDHNISPESSIQEAKRLAIVARKLPGNRTVALGTFDPEKRLAILGRLILAEMERWPSSERPSLAAFLEEFAKDFRTNGRSKSSRRPR